MKYPTKISNTWLEQQKLQLLKSMGFALDVVKKCIWKEKNAFTNLPNATIVDVQVTFQKFVPNNKPRTMNNSTDMFHSTYNSS